MRHNIKFYNSTYSNFANIKKETINFNNTQAMKSQVTLKMIAQKLNLSTSTVSRALADQWDVNSQTKKIVTDLAIELNYKPNIMAGKLNNARRTTPKQKNNLKSQLRRLPANSTSLLQQFTCFGQ